MCGTASLPHCTRTRRIISGGRYGCPAADVADGMIEDMAEFLSMGGYAAFVWPAYGIAALVMAGLLVATLRDLRRREALLRMLEENRPRRRKTRPVAGPAAGPSAEGGSP